MDHAGWMQSQHDCEHDYTKRNGKARPAGQNIPDKLNEFQQKVCDIIGIVGGGIYNAPCNTSKINWKFGFNGVSVLWERELATWDFNALTNLVFLCHAARIRCSISPSMRNLRISFWQRTEEGDVARRHPDLAEAVEQFQALLPTDHRIRYRTPEPPILEETQKGTTEL